MKGFLTSVFMIVVAAAVSTAWADAKFCITPYLQRPSTNAMTLLFFTDRACAATVKAWLKNGTEEPTAECPLVLMTQGVWAKALTNNVAIGTTYDNSVWANSLYRHRVRFEGLEANRIYRYVADLGTVAYTNEFRTAPDRNTPVRFVSYADCETTASPWTNYVKNLKQMKTRDPDFFALAGDLAARGGIQSHWDGFWKANAGTETDVGGSIPILTAVGNHDLFDNSQPGDKVDSCWMYDMQGEPSTERFVTYFEVESNGVDFASAPAPDRDTHDMSQLFHRVDYGPVTLLFIDTNNGRDGDTDDDHDHDSNYFNGNDGMHLPGGLDRRKGCRHPDFNVGTPQYVWLTNNLADAQAKARFTFVLNHHCPYSQGSHNKDWRTGEDGSALALRFLTETFVRYGVDGWLCGHDEILEHSITNGWEILPDGSRRKHTLSIYDLGCSGDSFRNSNAATNPLKYYTMTTSGYGFLETDVTTNANGRWTCTITPINASGTSCTAYPDQIVIEENAERAEDENDVIYTQHRDGNTLTKAFASEISATKPASWLAWEKPPEDREPSAPVTFDGYIEDWPSSATIAIGTNLVLRTRMASAETWSVTSSKESGYLDTSVAMNDDNTATVTLAPKYAYSGYPLTVKYGSTTLKEFEIHIPAEEHTLVLSAGETFTTNVVFFKETTWSVTGGKYVTAASAASGKTNVTELTIRAGGYSVSEDVTVSRVNSNNEKTPMHVYHVTVTDGTRPPEPSAAFTVTPYVQRPATNAMTVLFFTDAMCAATVRCWPADEADGVVTQTLAATCAEAEDLGVRNATDDVLTWAKQHRHRVRFEGLTPGTRYAYEVRLGAPDGEGPVYANFFRTVPGRDTPVRFVAYSDSETIPPTYSDSSADSAGCTTEWDVLEGGKNVVKTYHVSRSEGFASNLVHMAAWEPDLYLVAGDLVARGGVQMFWDEYWKENAGGLGLGYGDPAGSVPILATLGNHDLYDNSGSGALKYQYNKSGERALAKYLSYFEFNSNGVDYASAAAGDEQDSRDKSQLFYREDYGPVTLIFLDTNNGDDSDKAKDTNTGLKRSGSTGARSPDFNPGSLQYQWLERNLVDAQKNARFTIVVSHQCPYSVGKHNVENGKNNGSETETVSGLAARNLTPLMHKYGVDAWLCGHEEIQEHSQLAGTEELPDGSTRVHVLNVYSLGSAGDGLKGKQVVENEYSVFHAYKDSPDGTHYGHLRVEVGPSNGVWQCALTPVYSYVTSSHSSELRAYKDKIIINEGGDIAYEERLEPEREADVTIDSLYASRSQTVTTTGKAGAWTCEVGDERFLSAAVARNANGSATVTVTGLAETAEEQTVRVYASSGTGTEPMLVKVITVRAVVALPPEPAAEEDIAVSIDAGASSNIVTTTAADSWFCKVPSGMSNYVTASATRQPDGTATISISTGYAYGSPIAVEVYAHSDFYAKDYLVKTITVTVVGEIEVIPASEDATNITVATAGVLQVVTTTGAATHWNCRCVAKSDVDWAACIEASVVRNADGTATVTVLPKGAYGDKLTVEVYAGSTVPGEGTLIKKITVSKIVAATVALRLKEGETFVTNCTFGVAHPWSCSTDRSGAYVTASVTTAEATETTLTIVGKAVGTETVTVKRTNGSYTTDAYKFAVTVVTGEPTPYENLRAAFEVGTGTYALEADVVCPAGEPLTLAAGKSFVLDLNGHSLTCRRDGAIVNAGDLTIRDSTASGPFAAHVSFSEEELDAGCALVRNRAGAKLTVDGVCIDAGSISEDDYESACANTAVSDEGGTVVVTNGAHVGGLCGIEAKGDCAIVIEDGASVCGTSWRGTGGRQLSTAVLFASGTSVLTVRNATLDSEGWLVRSLEGSAATVSVSGAILWSERASVPFELASGTSVSVVGSNYADLSNIPAVTALANAGAALTVGAGCTLTVSGEGVIGFLGEGVRVEAAGTRTWRTVAETPSGGAWAAVSQALGAETEFAHEPAVSFVTLEALPTEEGRDLTVRVAVRDGEDIRKVDPAKVAGFVEATSDLSDWTAGKVGLTVKSAVRNDDNTMDIVVGLSQPASSVFMRIRVR